MIIKPLSTHRAQMRLVRPCLFRLTKAFDMEKREKLRPILSILDVLVEYELLSELNLDSTWRFVSYLLCDDDMDNLVRILLLLHQ